jgi:hypothetical protein
MADPLEIHAKILFHLYRHPILEQVLLLSHEIFGQSAQALLGKPAIGGTPEIHLRIHDLLVAVATSTGGIILEKFHHMPAFRTFGLKNGILVPILGILSRTLHHPPSFKKIDTFIEWSCWQSALHPEANLLYIKRKNLDMYQGGRFFQ